MFFLNCVTLKMCHFYLFFGENFLTIQLFLQSLIKLFNIPFSCLKKIPLYSSKGLPF